MSRISDLAGFTTALSTTQDLSVGVITATSFSGDLTGDVTGDVTGNASGTAGGLSGTPNITVGAINASSGTVSGNLSIGGTLTYQDVTNVDAVGMVTARKGIQVLADGINVTGVGTFNTSAKFAGITTADATGVVVTGVVSATSFDGNLNASQLASGTVPDARFPAALPAVSGENLTNLPASGDSNDITASLFI